MSTLPDVLTVQERRKRNREEMREDILTLARAQMRAEGAGALSFNQIARDLGMKPPSLYTYFPNKMAIYDALFRKGFELYGEWVEERLEADGTLAALLRSAFEAYFSFALAHPELYQIMFERPIPGFEPSEESMAVSLAQLQRARALTAALREREQLATELPVEKVSDLVIALVHGMTALHLANEPHLPMGEGRFGSLIPHAVDVFIAAWQPDE